MSLKTNTELQTLIDAILNRHENRYLFGTDLQGLFQDIKDSKEHYAGLPSVNGQVLASQTNGTRSWVTLPSQGLTNITGLITAGSNITISGSGTSGSPYVINSSGGGGGDFIPLAGTTNWSGNILSSVDDIAIGTHFSSSTPSEGAYIRFNETGTDSYTHVNSGVESNSAFLRVQGYDNGASYTRLGVGTDRTMEFDMRVDGASRTQILTNDSNGYSVQFTSSNPGSALAYWDVVVSGGGSSRSFFIDNDSIRFGGGVVTYNVSRITEINNNIHSLISREYADLTYSKLNGGADIEITDPNKGIVLTDSNLDRYRLTISTSGTLVITPV